MWRSLRNVARRSAMPSLVRPSIKRQFIGKYLRRRIHLLVNFLLLSQRCSNQLIDILSNLVRFAQVFATLSKRSPDL